MAIQFYVIAARRWAFFVLLLILIAVHSCSYTLAQSSSHPISQAPQKVILDTDIGDDIDDAFALGLVLSSPELKLLGVTTAWGDTSLRARLVKRLLCETGQQVIPVAAGPATKSTTKFTQAAWAARFPPAQRQQTDAISWMIETIRKNPGQITLIAIAPLHNVAALLARDPETFHKLKRVVLMGGSIRRGYGDLGYTPDHGPTPEYNIAMDIPAAQKLFASGIPIYMLPLDSTQMKLNEVLRGILFERSTPLTDSLALLYNEWSASTNFATPTLYDEMAVVSVIDDKLCPFQPMHIRIDAQGYTRREPGTPNAFVCLNSSQERFFHFTMPRLLQQHLAPKHSDAACALDAPR